MDTVISKGNCKWESWGVINKGDKGSGGSDRIVVGLFLFFGNGSLGVEGLKWKMLEPIRLVEILICFLKLGCHSSLVGIAKFVFCVVASYEIRIKRKGLHVVKIILLYYLFVC